jgi:thiamine-monophosphate kinase
LQILEREKKIFLEHPTIQPDFRGSEYVIAQLLRPVAQKNAINILAEAKLKPTAMMDISDGLASEIFHICKQSGVGAILEESHIPIHPQTFDKAAMEFKIDPITCALNGGEDYQLLFTISPDDFAKMQVLPNIYVIGEIVEKTEGIRLRTKSGNFHDLKAQGWQHF